MSPSGVARRGLGALVVLVPAGFLAVFYLAPVANVIGRGLTDDGGIAVTDLVTDDRLRSVLWFSVWQAAVSTLLTVAIALPGAAAVARARGWRQRALRAVATVPFVLPTVVVAGAFDTLFGRWGLDDGALRLRGTVWAILIAHVFFNYAVVVRAVGSYWAGLDHRPLEVARVLGAGPIRAFVEVTLPRLRPALVASGAVVFLFSFTSFGVVLVLGGLRRSTIETEIYRFAVTRTDIATAATLAAVQLGAVLALLAVTTWLERRRPAPDVLVRTPPRRPAPVLRLVNVSTLLGLFAAPIAVLVERSLRTGDGYGLANYRALGERLDQLPAPATTALVNSLWFALAAMVISVVVGVAAALVAVHGRRGLRGLFDLGLTLPLGTSAVTIGFGILITLDSPPVDWRTERWIVPVAHALVGIPFVVRTLVPVLRRIDPAVREAAATLGASPGRARREIDLPVGARATAIGAAFAFAVSIGEFGATSFLPRSPDSLTAPVALFRLLTTPGEALRGQAMALAVVLATVVALSVLIVESVRSEPGGSL